MELSSLPDDELLLVLSYLTPKELFQSRAVCLRWREMALHPLVWRNQRIDCCYKNLGIIYAVLRLAPRLHCLNNRKDWLAFNIASCGTLFLTTCCAISEVRLDIGPKGAVMAAAFIKRQASLGRLKKVGISVSGDGEKSDSLRLRALLHQLVHTPGLEEIKVARGDISEWPALQGAVKEEGDPVPASLRKLTYWPLPYLDLYLKWHAATLEVVNVGYIHPHVMPLLCALPRLRMLSCTTTEDMSPLLKCESLKALHLIVDVDDTTRHRLPSVESYLSEAVTRLEELVLDFQNDEVRADEINLVLCLRGSADSPASLRRLTFELYDPRVLGVPSVNTDIPPQLRPLALVLDRLPLLTHLNINIFGTPSDEFLQALDGHVLPELVQFEINSPGECMHEWAHNENVAAVMRRYSKLHIVIGNCSGALCPVDDCDFCEEFTCHNPSAFSRSDFLLYTHAEGAQCSLDHNCSYTPLVIDVASDI